DNLTTQDAQVACFQNAADHLTPSGRFVIETLVPPIRHLPPGTPHLAFDKSETHWGIDTFDLVNQTFTSSHIWMEDGEMTHFSAPFRYAWPAEMDLMARLAGMTLESRCEDWAGATFTGDSRKHVSVWRKDA
ncbi:MAG: SAM-dependent methyltransferase, partial [Pseudomonadota bacterium]